MLLPSRCMVLTMCVLYLGCEPETVSRDEIFVVHFGDDRSLLANGNDTLWVFVEFNPKADVASEVNVSVQNATINGRELTERAFNPVIRRSGGALDSFMLITTTRVEPIQLGIEVRGYLFQHKIELDTSFPVKMVLSANSFSVPSNFEGEIIITGALRSTNGEKVSDGTAVVLMDYFSDGTLVNGEFRNGNQLTSLDGRISVDYSPGLVEPGQFIVMKGTVIGDTQSNIEVSDSIQIYVN